MEESVRKIFRDILTAIQNISVTVDPPVGGATEAKQDTLIAAVDGVESLLTTISGNIADIETLQTTGNASLSVLDDWDESDRAKVNLIAGQAGIAGGTGVDGATVPRVTLATNVGLPAGTNNIGDVDILTNVPPTPNTTGGYDVANNIDVDETEDAVKTSAGKLYGWFWYNDGAAEVYIKYYNDTVANITVGSSTPFMTIAIPAGGASNVEFGAGIPFSSAITIAATTGVATADTGAPAANQVVGFSLYK